VLTQEQIDSGLYGLLEILQRDVPNVTEYDPNRWFVDPNSYDKAVLKELEGVGSPVREQLVLMWANRGPIRATNLSANTMLYVEDENK